MESRARDGEHRVPIGRQFQGVFRSGGAGLCADDGVTLLDADGGVTAGGVTPEGEEVPAGVEEPGGG